MNDRQLSLELCQPVAEHARQVMQWRNDPETLAMSYHQTPKQWPAFLAEFCRDYFVRPDLPPAFVLHQGLRVAFLRFESVPNPEQKSAKTVEISINIAPAFRGRGWAVPILKMAADSLFARGFDVVSAEVRVENVRSKQMFLMAGYRLLDQTIKEVADTGESCAIYRFLLDSQSPFWLNDRVFIIAEAGSNWRMGSAQRDLAMGRALIDVAKESGADAVKFQTYRANTTYVENAGASEYLAKSGIKEDISSIFADLAMPDVLVAELAEYCQKQEIQFISSPFSVRDFQVVDPYVTLHKIASYEISHRQLIQLAAQSGKPTILSTGASSPEDIDWAVDFYHQAGGKNLCLMQCTAKYPCPLNQLNLAVIPWLKQRFSVASGFSDHSRHPLYGPLAAVAMGAQVIEKHFTLDNRLPGPDHAFALTPKELARMVTGIRSVELTLQGGKKEVLPVENELAAYARRGLQAIRPIARGEVFQLDENIAILRPGSQQLGIHPRHLERLAGKMAVRDIPLGDGIVAGDWLE
ncbi:MAG: GNAT family N-acetyltransferase [Magnetococcales bacterium]|nr:GNAT family N-acetyltransferase [Magnetococcales bacterium]